jgi:N-acetylmuramoyl-L-alanine amidase
LASTGFEIYYYSPPLLDPNKTYSIDDFAKTANSRLLANKIEQSLFSAIGEISKSRGVKQADYYVLKNNLCPAVLIECGFISNPDEALLFIDPVYVKKITLGIMQGIADYISVIENSEGGTSYD